MIENDLEHVVKQPLLKLIVSPLALAYEECLSIDVSERAHLPDRSIGYGDKWLALAGCRQMVFEVSEGMG